MKRVHRAGMQAMCEASRADIMKMMDWYVVREDDGAYLGFRAHPSGHAKVLAVAHVDYLCSGKVHKNNRKRIVSSALDDRAGVYIALEMLEDYGIAADVVLTDEEESGQSTLPMFGAGMLKKYNWIVQLDRRGTDAVTYGYTEITEILAEFWEVARGSRSDISYLEDICPVSAFNLGVGYHQEHNETCHLIYRQLHRQLGRLKEFYDLYREVQLSRKHFDGELQDVPLPPPPVWRQPTFHRTQVLGFNDLERCTWCQGKVGFPVHVTDWGSRLCEKCWSDWTGKAKPEDSRLTWCADCGDGTLNPRIVGGKSYCVDCAPLAEIMQDPFGCSD